MLSWIKKIIHYREGAPLHTVLLHPIIRDVIPAHVQRLVTFSRTTVLALHPKNVIIFVRVNHRPLALIGLFIIGASLVIGSGYIHANATIQVDSVEDTFTIDTYCTLREAAVNADSVEGDDLTGGDCDPGSATGVDTITFSGPMTIALSSDLVINSPVFLDGITGTGGVCSSKELAVVISGTYFIDLGTSSSGSSVRGLNIQGGGIRLQDSSGTTVQCNMIGLDQTGLTAVGGFGINMTNGSNHVIGGSSEGDGNVLSGNNSDRSGISINGGAGVVVKGNIIGLDKNGDVAMLTQRDGMNISGEITDLTIGGPGEFERNIISGNHGSGSAHGIIFLNGEMSDITIQNNYIGTDRTGMMARPNNDEAIDFCDSVGCPGDPFSVTGLLIGGTGANERNIFSGNNGAGISLKKVDDFVVEGNYFGLNAAGTGLLANVADNFELESSFNGRIGGATAQARNYFVGTGGGGSEGKGLHIRDFLGTSLTVVGNYFGLGTSGEIVGGFSESVLVIFGTDASGITIGGAGAGEGNVIAGGLSNGIAISADGVRVFGNKIGTNPAGLVQSGYGNEVGVLVSSADEGYRFVGTNVKIGGINPGEANIVAGNTEAGVVIMLTNDEIGISSIIGNSILGNSIFGNNTNGIDHLFFDEISAPAYGSTPNDSGDADTGPNNLLNHPAINSVDIATGDVEYTLDVPGSVGTPKYYRVEFYKNPTSGTYGEGETFLGYDTFVSEGDSKQQTKTLSLTSGDYVTATATECTNDACTAFLSTSEFSQAYEPIVATTPITPVVPVVQGGGTVLLIEWLVSPEHHAPEDTVVPTSIPVIEPVTTNCPVFTQYFKKGDNNPEVKLIQAFLSKELGIILPVSGMYGPQTEQAVRKFQMKYSKDILEPWDPPYPVKSTGFWYKTTSMKANQLERCSSTEVILDDTGRYWKL